MGQIAGPDIRGMEAGVTPQQPCFSVQSGAVDFIVDADIRPELVDESIKSAGVRRAEVRRCDDTKGDAAPAQFAKLVLEQSEALPFDESAQQVDVIGAHKLGAKLGSQCRFVARIGHERGVGEWGGRPWQTSTTK